MKRKHLFREHFTFLYPNFVIKSKNFTRQDVRKIKDNITINFGVIRLATAVLIFLVSFFLMLFMRDKTGGQQVEVYGLASIVSQIVSMFGAIMTFGLIVPTLFIKNERVNATLNRIAAIILFCALGAQMLLGIYSDAHMQISTQTETISASIVIISLLFLIQPAYWIDALICNATLVVSYFVICTYCSYVFEMKVFYYYALVGTLYPIFCYCVISLLFYAESQHYKDILDNERLTDEAYYDSLTQCKNRYSLTKYLKDNEKRWEYEEVNLLIILFDIDNFKQYNDQFSHIGGDYCLKLITESIRRTFVSPSLDFFRYGGEEFLLFFELDNPDEAASYLEKARNSVKELKIESPKGSPKDVVTISLGGVLLTNIKDFSFEDEMRKVDEYLYISKGAGKDISCLNGHLISNKRPRRQ